ncbi:MAG: dihydropteroate synthase [Clostridiales bacterium]|nr:dihydropteroate synthase [Clostridiales bacterium]
MIIGGRAFKNYTYVMAIINLTPDSFYAGSRRTCDDVLFATEKAVKDGAAIIDLGAQSTRPGYAEISAEQEISRLEKPLRLIKEKFDIPVSVDTYFEKCAAFALSAGADMINDIWGLTHDSGMAATIAKYNASVCIMHNATNKVEGDLWQNVLSFLKHSADIAIGAGIDRDKICIDGGIGFAKDREQNFELLNGYDKLHTLGYPSLLGCSRKSMFGGLPEDRLKPTVEATRVAAKKGVLFVRVHDVKENAKAIEEVYNG